jgi:hypothetical protein
VNERRKPVVVVAKAVLNDVEDAVMQEQPQPQRLPSKVYGLSSVQDPVEPVLQ